MKKIMLLFLIYYMSFIICIAEEMNKETLKLQGQIEYGDNIVETIYLDDNVEKPQINIQQKMLTLPTKKLNITSNTNSPRSALARSFINNRNNIKDILPLSGVLSEQYHGFTYGTTWGQELSFSQMESTTGVFLRYDTPKFFSFDTTFKQSSSQDIGKLYGTLKIAPEWHITDKLTLKNTFTNYLNAPKNKNELTLIYKPTLQKYADSLKFELGIAQSYYTNGRQSSAVSFSTNFRL